MSSLKKTILEVIPARKKAFLAVKSTYGNKILGSLPVASTLGGMRGSPMIYWESSKVDPNRGVTFHGKTIAECQAQLPHSRFENNSKLSEFLPESMFYYLLTGKIPTQHEVDELSREFAAKGQLPEYLLKIVDSLPRTMHPMTQLSIGISALNNESSFASAYARGISKTAHWEYIFDDSINLLAKLPALIGRIYQNTYTKYGHLETLGEIDPERDWSYNLASMMGFNTSEHSKNIKSFSDGKAADYVNLVRLYCALHADHEGGNVSSHTTHLVGSALSDPFLSYSAGVQGLAGPLHGLAAQEVVRFILGMQNELKLESVESVKKLDNQIKDYLWSVLNSKRVIPGYGHAVLRNPDPRFEAMMNFGLSRRDIADNDVLFNLVHKLSQIAPGVLKEQGKTKNPFPNVDSSSGVLFYHHGLKDTLFYTVIFAGSRAFGPLNQLIWDRILGLPIERPKSLDLKSIVEFAH